MGGIGKWSVGRRPGCTGAAFADRVVTACASALVGAVTASGVLGALAGCGTQPPQAVSPTPALTQPATPTAPGGAPADLDAAISRSGRLLLTAQGGKQSLAARATAAVYLSKFVDTAGATHRDVLCVRLELVNASAQPLELSMARAGEIVLADGTAVRSTPLARGHVLDRVSLGAGQSAEGWLSFVGTPWDELDAPIEPSPVRLKVDFMLAAGLGQGIWLVDGANDGDLTGSRRLQVMLVGAAVHYLLL